MYYYRLLMYQNKLAKREEVVCSFIFFFNKILVDQLRTDRRWKHAVLSVP